MFNPHGRLAPGIWYWQYGTMERAGKVPVWSEVYRFEVDADIRQFATPPAEKMLVG